MTTSLTTTKSEKISRGDMAYACARNMASAHSLLLRAIKESGLTQKELSLRTGIDEAAISRVLAHPKNFEINTLSKLVFGAIGDFVEFKVFRHPAKTQRVTNQWGGIILSSLYDTSKTQDLRKIIDNPQALTTAITTEPATRKVMVNA